MVVVHLWHFVLQKPTYMYIQPRRATFTISYFTYSRYLSVCMYVYATQSCSNFIFSGTNLSSAYRILYYNTCRLLITEKGGKMGILLSCDVMYFIYISAAIVLEWHRYHAASCSCRWYFFAVNTRAHVHYSSRYKYLRASIFFVVVVLS